MHQIGSLLVYQCCPRQALFEHMIGSFQAKAIFCRQSSVLISSICEYAIPCPQRFSILISSILFVKDLTAYGSNICLGGTCRPPVTPLCNVLAKGAHKASDTLRIFRWGFYVAVHEGVKKGIHCWKSDCTLT